MHRCRTHLDFVRLIAALAIVIGCFRTAHADERQYWLGEILMPNAACPRVAFAVTFKRTDAAAAWTGSLSIPRGCGVGGIMDAPLAAVSVTDERLSFVMPPPTENAYQVRRTPGERIATGEVIIAGTQVPIRMWPATEAEVRNAAPRRPQMPAGDLPYAVAEVRVPAPYVDGSATELSGSLSTPPGAGPFPAIVLVTDAEPHDRDHSEATHKQFAVLADRLTRAGYVVLRCDDRGIGESGGSCVDTTLDDAAKDVAAQVAYLAKTPGVDATRIGVIGRGEGAQVGAIAAGAEGSGITILVMLGASGQRGIEVSCQREESQLKAIGEDAAYISARVARLRNALELATTEGKETELDAVLREDARAYVESVRGMGIDLTQNQIAMWASSRVSTMLRPRFKSWLTMDPAEALKRVKCPVLVMSGAMDMQMPPAEQIPAIRSALEEGGNTRVTVKVLARTNHALQPCATGFDDEVGSIETTISEEAVKGIVDFLGSAVTK